MQMWGSLALLVLATAMFVDGHRTFDAGTCLDQAGWKDSSGSGCGIYVAHGHCSGGKIVSTKHTKQDMATWGTPPPYEACCACGGGTAVHTEHVGFQDVDWWNPKLWRTLDASTPRVACNPARCGNPEACNIPNCTLVDHDEFYHNRHANDNICTTGDKQNGTASSDCVPSSMRKAWPSINVSESEGVACRTAFDKPDETTGCGTNCQIYYPSVLIPATRMAFCDANFYVTNYYFAVPAIESQPSDKWPPSAQDWLWGKRMFVYTGGWTVTTRNYYAWPFTEWTVAGGISTQNVGLFIWSRNLCKLNDSTGVSDCWSVKNTRCFQTTHPFANAAYPSKVGTTQLAIFANDQSKKPCSTALEAKIAPHIAAFIASQ